MYEQQIEFQNFVASRPLSRIEKWAGTHSCPIIQIDGTEDWRTSALYIAEQFYNKNISDEKGTKP